MIFLLAALIFVLIPDYLLKAEARYDTQMYASLENIQRMSDQKCL